MGKRGAWLLAAFGVLFAGLLRCSTKGDAPPIGYDEILEHGQPQPKITAPSSVTVVRGESTTIPVTVTAATFAAFSNLPVGVTASTFSGSEIVLSADASAPSAKVTASLTATTTDSSTISKTVTVYVTGIDGSRDPVFYGGYLGDDAVGLSVLADGRVVALTQNAVLSRFQTTGALDTWFGTGGRVTLPFSYARAMDVASDGRTVVACSAGIVVVGPDGAIERTIAADAGYSYVHVFWSGTNIVLVESNFIASIDPNDKVTSGPLPTDYDGAYAAPGGRIALTRAAFDPDGGSPSPEITMLAPSQGWYALDATFGSTGVAKFPDGYAHVTSIASTSAGKLLVQTSGQYASDIVQLDGAGALDTSWGQQGYTSVTQTPGTIVATPSNRLLATGVTTDLADSLVAVERFLSDGTLDPAFGFQGRVLTDLSLVQGSTAGVLPPLAAIDPLETVLYVAGHGWLLRYRIHA